MSLLKHIDDKGAVLEWCPIPERSNIVALGTKDSSGVGFDDFGGEVELHSLDFSDYKNTSTNVICKARASSRFSSIAWSQMAIHADVFPLGLIAGGMVDGTINVWDPAKMAEGTDSLLASVEQHQGSISGLHFNPHKESSHLLASGGSDCEVFVTSIEDPTQPSVFIPAPPPNNSKHLADITKVAWNTQVAHILASASQNGSTFIWDLRQKKAWCELRDPSGCTVSDIAWNPEEGLHLVTASGDDRNPVLKLWDLRSSTSLPLATLQGHTQGILSVSWCPNDSSLLMSCGKDNKTLLWDLFHLQPVYELPAVQTQYGQEDSTSPTAAQDSSMFGGFGAVSNAGRRHHVSWSPCLPGVLSTCSFDRRVQFHSVVGAKSKVGRAPKWLNRPVGAAFGFGGKLVTFTNRGMPLVPVAGKKGTVSIPAKTWQVCENKELVAACDKFTEAVAQESFKEFCEYKTNSSDSSHDAQVWSLMSVICFGSNAREELLTHLGFDSNTISKTAEEYVSKAEGSLSGSEAVSSNNESSSSTFDPSPTPGTPSAEDVFGSGEPTPTPPVATVIPSPTIESVTSDIEELDLNSLSPDMSKSAAKLVAVLLAGQKAEPMVRKAIIVGNFEAAVECCLHAGLLAEALLLCQCGDQSLRVRTQAAFFKKKQHEHPFLSVLHAVIKNELLPFVMQSDLANWRETLALLSTYGKSDEFPGLCEALAERLEKEAQDPSSACLCFMCAANVERTVEFWTRQLNDANKRIGYLDTKELQNYVEKVTVFTRVNTVNSLSAECSSFFTKYAEIMANEGRLDVALTYLSGESSFEISVLVDRLYHAGNKKAGSRPPAFPFVRSTIEVTTAASGNTTTAAKSVNNNTAITTPAGHKSGGGANGGRLSLNQNLGGFPVSGTTSSGTMASPMATSTNPAAMASATSAAAAVTSPTIPSAQAQAGSTLPPGWSQMVDPTSGYPYYVNQVTGQSQWEAPAMQMSNTKPPSPMNRQLAMHSPSPLQQATQSHTIQQGQQPAQPMQSMQQAAAQPQTFSPVPQTEVQVAQPSASPADSAASSGAPAVSASANLEDTLKRLETVIQEITGAAGSSGMERKQVTMIQSSYTHLCEKYNNNGIAPDIMSKLTRCVDYLAQRNFSGATTVQTDLANTAWGLHKEWIKGIKVLIQMGSKNR